jgi:hypothetical protein
VRAINLKLGVEITARTKNCQSLRFIMRSRFSHCETDPKTRMHQHALVAKCRIRPFALRRGS